MGKNHDGGGGSLEGGVGEEGGDKRGSDEVVGGQKGGMNGGKLPITLIFGLNLPQGERCTTVGGAHVLVLHSASKFQLCVQFDML